MKIYQFAINIASKEAVRFLLAGLLNTIFGYAIYAIFIYFKVPYSVALFIATITGILFNYFTFGNLVFFKSNLSIFIKFISTYLLTYLLNIYLLGVLNTSTPFGLYIDQLLCLILIISLNWFTMKYLVFKSFIKPL